MRSEKQKRKLPKPPRHLRKETRNWWASVAADYELELHHLRLLTLAAEAWDRAQQAREIVAKEGAYFRDRFDCPRAHPGIAVERDNRIAFARMLRELSLDVAQPEESRPARLGR